MVTCGSEKREPTSLTLGSLSSIQLRKSACFVKRERDKHYAARGGGQMSRTAEKRRVGEEGR